eukprot:6208943-Pleurochrysis_carterae.AAC.2
MLTLPFLTTLVSLEAPSGLAVGPNGDICAILTCKTEAILNTPERGESDWHGKGNAKTTWINLANPLWERNQGAAWKAGGMEGGDD